MNTHIFYFINYCLFIVKTATVRLDFLNNLYYDIVIGKKTAFPFWLTVGQCPRIVFYVRNNFVMI